jgi:deoxyribonuclease V
MRSKPLEGVPNLWKATYDLVAQVPEGKVTTYGEVAKALGDIVASRFVGLAMSKNDDIVRVPCRRVIRSDGFVGGYTGGGPERKIKLLRKEGIEISDWSVVNLERVLFKDFKTTHPLKKLRRQQTSMKNRLILDEFKGRIRRVAGMDVAYKDEHAYAAMVTFDYESGEETDRTIVEGDAKFPYIPTYLAFREMPIVGSLMKQMDLATVLMYDGNGILHPEGFGIASQIGVAFNAPTVGVAKKLLCGTVAGRSSSFAKAVVQDGRIVGYAVVGRANRNPVYVSAGHKVSSEQARDLAVRFLEHRVPEPTRVAHMVAEGARLRTNHK